MSCGAKEAENVPGAARGEARGGHGRVLGLHRHPGSPAGSVLTFPPVLPLGVPPCPRPGAEGEDGTGATGPLPAPGGVGHSLTPAAPCGSPGWVLLVLSFAGGHVWGLELDLRAEIPILAGNNKW